MNPSISMWLVGGVMAVAVLEAAALVLRHRLSGRGPSPARLLPNLAAGFCLLLALLAALSGAQWGWLAACLAGSGIAHVIDLRGR